MQTQQQQQQQQTSQLQQTSQMQQISQTQQSLSQLQQQIKLQNIKRLTHGYIIQFVIPEHIDYKKNDIKQTVKGYIEDRFVLFIDLPNNVLIFTPFISDLIENYNIGQNIIIISETLNKEELMNDINKHIQEDSTLQYMVYKNGQFIM